MRRREFLIASSMAAALSTATRGLAAPEGASRDASIANIAAVVYAPRYALAREFAQQHAARGVQTFSADRCMVGLWRGPLTQLAKNGSLRFAGTTLYSDFAIARDFSRELGGRVLREEWLRDGPVALVTWLIGAP